MKFFVRTTDGLAGTVKIEVAFGKAIVMVSPARSEPLAVVVKPTAQVARALADNVVAPKVTAVGVVAAPITGATPTLAAAVSAVVLTIRLAAPGEPAAPAVIPLIWRVAGVAFGRAQGPPLSARVIVTTVPAPVAVPIAQFLKPEVRVTTGLAGTVKTEVTAGKAIVIVSPACR